MNGAPSEPRTSCRRRKSARRRSAASRDDLERLDPEPCTSSRSVDKPKPAGLPGSFREPAAAKAGTWRVAAGPAIFRFPGHCRSFRQGRAARGTISAGWRFLRSASSPCPARLRLGGAFLWDGLPRAGAAPCLQTLGRLRRPRLFMGEHRTYRDSAHRDVGTGAVAASPTSLAPVPFYAERYFGALRRPFSQPSRPRAWRTSIRTSGAGARAIRRAAPGRAAVPARPMGRAQCRRPGTQALRPHAARGPATRRRPGGLGRRDVHEIRNRSNSTVEFSGE